jgi:hypothetical protein
MQQGDAALGLRQARRTVLAGNCQRRLGGIDIAVQVLHAAEITIFQAQQMIEGREEALRITAGCIAAMRCCDLQAIQRLHQGCLRGLQIAFARLPQGGFVTLAGDVELTIERTDLGRGPG